MSDQFDEQARTIVAADMMPDAQIAEISQALRATAEAARRDGQGDAMGQAYQIVGLLVDAIEHPEDMPPDAEIERVLNYLSRGPYDDEFLPWPATVSSSESVADTTSSIDLAALKEAVVEAANKTVLADSYEDWEEACEKMKAAVIALTEAKNKESAK